MLFYILGTKEKKKERRKVGERGRHYKELHIYMYVAICYILFVGIAR